MFEENFSMDSAYLVIGKSHLTGFITANLERLIKVIEALSGLSFLNSYCNSWLK